MNKNLAGGIIGSLFALALGVIFATSLVAPQITGIFDTNTTGWDTGTAALWAVLAIVIVAVIVFLFLRIGGIVT
jgi:Na+/alanine symporter